MFWFYCNGFLEKFQHYKFYLILYLPDIDIMVKVFANNLGELDSIPGRVISKTQKNDTWCLLA